MTEILANEDDESSREKREASDDESGKRNKLLVDIWKQAVDTQKHFNDMCVKSRQLGLTFVAASLGAAFYLFIRSVPVGTEPETFAAHSISAFTLQVCGHTIVLHVSLAIIAAAAAAVFAVRHLDLGIYHKMLRGSVTFGEDLEEKHIRHIVGLRKGMTQTISHFSRYSDAAKKITIDGTYDYFGSDLRDAGQKLKRFYTIIFVVLGLFAALVICATNFMKAI